MQLRCQVLSGFPQTSRARAFGAGGAQVVQSQTSRPAPLQEMQSAPSRMAPECTGSWDCIDRRNKRYGTYSLCGSDLHKCARNNSLYICPLCFPGWVVMSGGTPCCCAGAQQVLRESQRHASQVAAAREAMGLPPPSQPALEGPPGLSQATPVGSLSQALVAGGQSPAQAAQAFALQDVPVPGWQAAPPAASQPMYTAQPVEPVEPRLPAPRPPQVWPSTGPTVHEQLAVQFGLLNPMTAFPDSLRIGPYEKNFVYQPATQDHQRICFFSSEFRRLFGRTVMCCLPKASPRPRCCRRGLL